MSRFRVNMRLFYIKLLSLGLVLGLSLSLSAQAANLPDFTALIEQNAATVVNISTRSAKKSHETAIRIPGMPESGPLAELFRRFLEEEGRNREAPKEDDENQKHARSLGSGFIISADGYIITNHHVIDGADEIIVRLSDRREFNAKVIGKDKRSDIAVLKVDADNLPVVKMGSSADLKVGEWVLAIGSPFGFEHTVTAGIVSAKGRSLRDGESSYVPFIQTDVAINPGNSGGPLFNLKGEVVGVNAQIYSRTGGFMGLSFTIPSDMVMRIVAQLREGGSVSRGWLGVLIQDVTRELAESFGLDKPQGALIAKVFEGPASKAGLQASDVILEINDQVVNYSSDLPPLVGENAAGNTVNLLILRQGKRQTIAVTLGELPNKDTLVAARSGGRLEDSDTLGLSISEPDSKSRKANDVNEGGVLIIRVKSKSIASKAGMQKSDLLIMLDGQRIKDIEHFNELVKNIGDKKTVPILLYRRGNPRFLVLKMQTKRD